MKTGQSPNKVIALEPGPERETALEAVTEPVSESGHESELGLAHEPPPVPGPEGEVQEEPEAEIASAPSLATQHARWMKIDPVFKKNGQEEWNFYSPTTAPYRVWHGDDDCATSHKVCTPYHAQQDGKGANSSQHLLPLKMFVMVAAGIGVCVTTAHSATTP